MQNIGRREFLAAASLAAAPAQGKGVTVVLDPKDPVTQTDCVQWAAAELRTALAGVGELTILAGGPMTGKVKAPAEAEGLAIGEVQMGGRRVLAVSGADSRGLVYGLLELADRARNSRDVTAALRVTKNIVERPANKVRSVTRLFTSDVEDLGWFHDREMWGTYLTMLATARFNRFNLSFGIGYDFLREVTDAYFVFLYPFLLAVPGHDVRVPQLPDAERDKNLEMLRFISEQTVARGMEFQLGIWTHGYEWINSPHPNYTIAGLNKQNHGPYCRDALRALLQALPAVSGVTLRVHGESGVEEGSYEFWKTVFDGVKSCGRRVEIDMHSKGMDQTMLDLGVSTGLPLKISPKFWAEHMGMPYHQTDIRPVEYPRTDGRSGALMKFSAGSRNFTRYGYADLMREDRKWGVLHRIWPGTQRLLMWGDPVFAAGYARAFAMSGSDGVEIMEPLSFKGRRGSGLAGDRCAYADKALRPRWDWEKYTYGHRVWGRLLYNPQTEAEVWQRQMRHEFGAGAQAAESALAQASRILPIVTTAHGPSAANNTYWPELYTNQPLRDEGVNPYGDTPAPKVFGNVSPFDPQLFYRMNDFADDCLKGKRSGKYSPVEVAEWIENAADGALKELAAFRGKAKMDRAEARRLAVDVAIQAGLGKFFGAKFRAGVLFRIFERTGSPTALEATLQQYRKARAAWAELAETAKGVYVSDITVGERPFLRGHWVDRLAAIDADIEAVGRFHLRPVKDEKAEMAIRQALAHPARRSVAGLRHQAAARFQAGEALTVELGMEKQAAARLYYRHLNHAERYQVAEMEWRDGRSWGVIPGAYTKGNYPIAYYFEVETEESAVLYPGLGEELTGQPYFLARM